MCSTYHCAWLWSKTWAEDLRPDRCGVMFEPVGKRGPEVWIGMVDPKRPSSFREGAARKMIERMTREGFGVILACGKDRHIVAPEWKTRDAVLHEYKVAVRKIWPSLRTQTT
jgi:hypothetical protein